MLNTFQYRELNILERDIRYFDTHRVYSYHRYSEIAQRQEMFWDAKRKHARETMEAYNQPPQRQRRKSNRESLGSENEERNVGRGRKSLRDSSLSDNDGEPTKHKKSSRSRKVSETTT